MSETTRRFEGSETILTYVYLYKAAQHLLEQAETEPSGSFYGFLACNICAAFMLEAYLNHLGAEILPFWRDIEEKLGPRQKLTLLAHHLGVGIE